MKLSNLCLSAALLLAPTSAAIAAGQCTFDGYERCAAGSPNCYPWGADGALVVHHHTPGLDPLTCSDKVAISWMIMGRKLGYCYDPQTYDPMDCPGPAN